MTELTMRTRLNNLEHRMDRVEQILPTLATKTDLERFATKTDLERFATKEELRAGLDEVRRHALVLHEDLKSDISLLAEHLSAVMQRIERR